MKEYDVHILLELSVSRISFGVPLWMCEFEDAVTS